MLNRVANIGVFLQFSRYAMDEDTRPSLFNPLDSTLLILYGTNMYCPRQLWMDQLHRRFPAILRDTSASGLLRQYRVLDYFGRALSHVYGCA